MAEHRNQGNRYFSEKKYEMAATCYGRAIVSVAKLVYSLIRYLCVYTYSTHVGYADTPILRACAAYAAILGGKSARVARLSAMENAVFSQWHPT